MIDRMEVLRLYRQVETWLQEGKFDEVDQFLQNLDFEHQPLILLIGSLRVTFCAKEKLLSWEKTLSCVIKEVNRRECDVKSLLTGLIDENDENP